jgi:hypothetical protein
VERGFDSKKADMTSSSSLYTPLGESSSSSNTNRATAAPVSSSPLHPKSHDVELGSTDPYYVFQQDLNQQLEHLDESLVEYMRIAQQQQSAWVCAKPLTFLKRIR